jgi:hypothetical protein
MAGDWIKMKSALANEPEVRGIAKRTGLDRFAVVGRLHAVWAYADSVTECGEIPYLDEGDIDKMVDHDGFADAMRQVGWLEVRDASIVIPAFETHNGKSAKRRSQTAKRNSEWRKKPDSTGTKRKRDAGSVTSASPREEKRREEKSADAKASATNAAAVGIAFNARFDSVIERTGFPKPDPNDQRAGYEAVQRIESGQYPEIDQSGIDDPLAWLEPRLARYWREQEIIRANSDKKLAKPSLRKSLAEDRWRIDLDRPLPEIDESKKPKPMNPARQRMLDRWAEQIEEAKKG